jgi:LPXTG-motif cell wall-anchored protein
MRVRRLVAALAGAGLVLLGSSTAASAAPTYPPAAPSLTVSASSIVTGGSVTITGTGFMPASTATVTWTGPGALAAGGKAFGSFAGGFRMGAKSLTADASGVVTTSVQLLSVGDHTITLAGTAADGTPTSLSTVVQVAATTAASGNLPHTGAPLMLYTLAGLMLVLLGALVVLVVRKRRLAAAVAAPVEAPVQEPVAS